MCSSYPKLPDVQSAAHRLIHRAPTDSGDCCVGSSRQGRAELGVSESKLCQAKRQFLSSRDEPPVGVKSQIAMTSSASETHCLGRGEDNLEPETRRGSALVHPRRSVGAVGPRGPSDRRPTSCAILFR